MESIKLQGTPKTPAVEFNTDLGYLIISGRSFSENPYDVFKPLIDLADAYSKNPRSKTTIEIHLDYFNSSTSKCLFQLLRKFQPAAEKSSVLINWHYEKDDEDTLQIIETYEEFLDIPIYKHVI